MRNAYPYPLPLHALQDFAHPDPQHQLGEPVLQHGQAYAGNGFIAIRAHKGAWLDCHIRPASPEIFARFMKLPWADIERRAKETTWKAADDQRGTIYQRARIKPWLGAQLAPSPIWAVNETPVRLSLLQMAAMLPRCEFFTGTGAQAGLYFRFSGGLGIIPRDRSTAPITRNLFTPNRNTWSGERTA